MEFAPTCPICGEHVVWEGNAARPFCSERCRLIDLGAWVSERYRVPGETVDSETDRDRDPDENEPE